MWNLCASQCPSLMTSKSSTTPSVATSTTTTTKFTKFDDNNYSNYNDETNRTSTKSWNCMQRKNLLTNFADSFNQIFAPINQQSEESSVNCYKKLNNSNQQQKDKQQQAPISIVNECWNDTLNKSITANNNNNTSTPVALNSKQISIIIDKQPNQIIDNKTLYLSGNTGEQRPSLSIIDKTTMDNHHNQSEYSRQYQWQSPMMIDTKPTIKPEPIMSQYQLSFGQSNGHHHPHHSNNYQNNNNQQQQISYSQPNSLTNYYHHQQHNHNDDVVDSSIINSNDNNNLKQQMSTTTTSSSSSTISSFRNVIAAPGNAVRNMVAAVEPEMMIKSATSSIITAVNIQNDKQIKDDRSQLITPLSTMSLSQQPQAMDSLKSSNALFDYEEKDRPPSSPTDNQTKSEYHSKFKDFNEYVYVEGDGFKKGDNLSLKAKQLAQAWFSEVNERSKQACKYRARSRNGATPVNPEYSWNGVPHKDGNDLAALALATRLVIEQKRSERNQSRSASAKPHLRAYNTNSNNSNNNNNMNMSMKTSSAPLSLQDDRLMSKSKPSVTVAKKSKVDRNNNNNSNNTKVVSTKIVSVKKPTQSTAAAATTAATTTTTATTDGPAKKIWIKPVKKIANETNESSTSTKTNKTNESSKNVNDNNNDNDNNMVTSKQQQEREFDPEPKQVPLHTTQIKSPEQLTGIKSPSPESWKVTIEKGGLNWINGNNDNNNNNNNNGQAPISIVSGIGTGTGTVPANFPIDTQSLIQQQQNDQMVRPVPINGMSRV